MQPSESIPISPTGLLEPETPLWLDTWLIAAMAIYGVVWHPAALFVAIGMLFLRLGLSSVYRRGKGILGWLLVAATLAGAASILWYRRDAPIGEIGLGGSLFLFFLFSPLWFGLFLIWKARGHQRLRSAIVGQPSITIGELAAKLGDNNTARITNKVNRLMQQGWLNGYELDTSRGTIHFTGKMPDALGLMRRSKLATLSLLLGALALIYSGGQPWHSASVDEGRRTLRSIAQKFVFGRPGDLICNKVMPLDEINRIANQHYRAASPVGDADSFGCEYFEHEKLVSTGSIGKTRGQMFRLTVDYDTASGREKADIKRWLNLQRGDRAIALRKRLQGLVDQVSIDPVDATFRSGRVVVQVRLAYERLNDDQLVELIRKTLERLPE